MGDIPPFIGVAVNITGIPAQAGLLDAVMEMLTGRYGFTDIAIVFEFAGFPVGQFTSDVRIQATISPITGIYE
jgi:hypothetical protein